VKRGEELGIVRGEVCKKDRVDQKLCFFRSGFEDIPKGVAYRKGLIQPRGKGSKVRSISGGGGVKSGAKQ